MDMARSLNGSLRRIPTWVVYIGGVLPAAVYFYWAVSNQLGADPLQALERRLGLWALQLLVLTLLVTPLRRWLRINLLKFRRAFGLLAFVYVCLHLLTWLILDKQFFWSEILGDLYKRPYIILGMTGFLLLVPLALTSNAFSIRWLGPKGWARLHRLSYVVILLGAVHYLMVVKAWPLQPLFYLGGVSLLVCARLRWATVKGWLGNAREPRGIT